MIVQQQILQFLDG